jgi:CDP-Glycerol:Poly(glycerophosphate) glycerophosphotransferase
VKPVWLVLPDLFSSRLFFDTGIVEKLQQRVGDRLELFVEEGQQAWAERAPGVRVTPRDELMWATIPLPEKLWRRADRWLDRRIGFYPLSLRHSLRHGFHRQRMRPGHSNWFLDPALAGPLPRWSPLDPLMTRWHYGRPRYLPRALRERLRHERPAIVLANLQMHSVVPFVVGSRRYRLPLVGHIASWDHTVGKGIVAPHADRYIVQNEAMRSDLVRFHGIDADRIVVTGWPQTDVFHRPRKRSEYERVLQPLGLDSTRPLVMVMGNTPTNSPYEANFVSRLVGWWKDNARDRFSLLFRPHPRDREWRSRFAAAGSERGAAVQEPSFTDLETLAVLLQHCDAVVTNAGTILLDALANDRPTVCTLWDEGAPPGESWAAKNVSGEHYKPLFESNAFYRATRFEEVVTGVERALAHPDELAIERARVVRLVMGEVDGRAAERVVDAIAAVVA